MTRTFGQIGRAIVRPQFKLARDLGLLWVGQIGTKGVAFMAFAILSRRLLPQDYGAVEYAMGLATLASLAIDGGMGSVGAMARGSADRYFQAEVRDTLKLVPEGIEGQVPYKGPVDGVLHQLVGGLRAGMGYLGAANLEQLRAKARYIRVSPAGLREAAPHDIIEVKATSNPNNG